MMERETAFQRRCALTAASADDAAMRGRMILYAAYLQSLAAEANDTG